MNTIVFNERICEILTKNSATVFIIIFFYLHYKYNSKEVSYRIK